MVDRRRVLLATGAAVIGVAGAGWSGFRRMGSMEDDVADLAPLRTPMPASPERTPPGRRPDLVMRFGRGPEMPFSARRPVDAVMAPA